MDTGTGTDTKTNERTDTFRQSQIGFMSCLLCALCSSIVPHHSMHQSRINAHAHNHRYPSQSTRSTYAGKAERTLHKSNKNSTHTNNGKRFTHTLTHIVHSSRNISGARAWYKNRRLILNQFKYCFDNERDTSSYFLPIHQNFSSLIRPNRNILLLFFFDLNCAVVKKCYFYI